MPIKTGRIKFNLRERGYRAHGHQRNFNVPLLVGVINGQATQERVASRSMLGYYGHWPRVKFGHLTSVEGGLEGGKGQIVEPALVTTYLKAHPDGTIEHEAEFLENDSGKVAARLNLSRAGGFSTVIDEKRAMFVGFDYVLEPNYRDNRGYTLDSASEGLTFDDACSLPLESIEQGIINEHLLAMGMLLDAAGARDELAAALIRQLEYEKEELLSMLASRNPQAAAVFDSAGQGKSEARVFDSAGADRMLAMAQAFKERGTLPTFVEPAVAIEPETAEQRADRSLIERATNYLLG